MTCLSYGMGGRVFHQETESALCEGPRYVLKLRENDREDPLHIALERGHMISELLPSSGQVSKLCCQVIGCLWSESLLLTQKELGYCEGILFVGLCFPQRTLCKVIDEKRIDNDNSIALCGKIREERKMIRGSGFHAQEEGRFVHG